MRADGSLQIHEFSGNLQNWPNLLPESRAFVERHINSTATEKHLVAPDFQIHVRLRTAQTFTLVSGSSSGRIAIRLARRACHIGADGRDRFHLIAPPRDTELHIFQLGREQHVKPGSFAFVSESEPCIVEDSNDGGRWVGTSLIVPRALIDHRLSVGERFCLRPYGGSENFRNLLLEALRSFDRNAWSLTHEEFLGSARTLTDLLLLALEGAADVLSDERPIRIANLARIKRIIRNRIAQPEVTPAAIAREAGASLSYVQKLFRDQGQTIYEYLKNERLLRAHDLLASLPSDRMTITDIFLRCGFSDKSYFSRSFKQKFGVTPSEVASRFSKAR